VSDQQHIGPATGSVSGQAADSVPETSTGSVPETSTGVLALVGGGEWQTGTEYDAELLERSGADEVLVLPTAAAYQHPDRAVATAETWFAALGCRARGLMVLSHADANKEANAAAVREARFIYLSGGSPLHLLSVLKGSLVFEALANALRHGAVVAGSSAGAMVLVDPMVDPRGGAFTVGLGLVEQLAVVPHHDSGTSHHFWRTLELAPAGIPIAGIPERTALIRDSDGSWRSAGEGQITVYVDGAEAGLDALPG
jgi:cyanophycinase